MLDPETDEMADPWLETQIPFLVAGTDGGGCYHRNPARHVRADGQVES